MEQRQCGNLHSAMKVHVMTTRSKKSSTKLDLTVVTPSSEEIEEIRVKTCSLWSIDTAGCCWLLPSFVCHT